MKVLYLILIAAALTAGCGKGKEVNNGGTVTVTGLLKVQSFTTYQYGTHTISNDKEFYALNSQTIHLDDYKDKTVTIKGNLTLGYPVEHGPQLLEVTSIKEQ
jgi:hypothetical protein